MRAPVAKLIARSALFLAAWTSILSIAHAGLGPEGIFLVVNRASWASLSVANEYISLRQIPPANVCYLDWRGGTDSIDVDTFRRQILGPILTQMEQRRLADQIDAIVYSADFPYQINLAGDLAGQQPPEKMSPHASITAATYLWRWVMSQNVNVISLENNQYARPSSDRGDTPLTQGFRSWYGWGFRAQLIEGGGNQYRLCTMLAVTSGRGNSIDEAIGCLRTAKKADGTRPKGTIYFCETDDIRSKTRTPRFAPAIHDLRRAGVHGEIVSTTLPTGKSDVAGLMAGIATFSWPASQSTILPGAVCEHLTSFGGALAEGNGQTPLTEFIRYGAAGASGAVVEPFSHYQKFPLADMQVHYARGATLAEAFYLSVFGPYQLLIVGDPLCMPWAQIPQVSLDDIKPSAILTGTADLAAMAKGSKVDRVHYFVDGRRVAQRPAGTIITLNTTDFADGYHEVTAVAITADEIETQGRRTVSVNFDNHKQTVELTPDKRGLRWGDTLTLKAKSSASEGGIVLANGLVVGQFTEDQGEVQVPARDLGIGPVTFLAISNLPKSAVSVPLRMLVTANDPLPALRSRPLVRGIRLQTASQKSVPVQETLAENWLKMAGVNPGEAFAMEGFFEVAPLTKGTIASAAEDVTSQDIRQFQVRYTGSIKLTVDETTLHEGEAGDYGQVFLPIALAPGLHRLRVAGRAGSDVKLQIRYGGEGTQSINGNQFRQASAP